MTDATDNRVRTAYPGDSSFVLGTWKRIPVFHRFGAVEGPAEDRYDTTACGLRLEDWTPHLALRHTLKFAKPCGNCYRDWDLPDA